MRYHPRKRFTATPSIDKVYVNKFTKSVRLQDLMITDGTANTKGRDIVLDLTLEEAAALYRDLGTALNINTPQEATS